MKNWSPLILSALLFLCTTSCKEVYFNNPQPKAGETLNSFPKEMHGQFRNTQFNKVLSKKDSSAYGMARVAINKLYYLDSASIQKDFSEIDLHVNNQKIDLSLKDKNNKTFFTSSLALSNTLVLKKMDNYLVINKMFTLGESDYQEKPVDRWQPLIFKMNKKNQWEAYFVQSPWDKKSIKEYEENSVIEEIDLKDLNTITRTKSNHLVTFKNDTFMFEPFRQSAYEKKSQRNEEKTLKKSIRKEKQEMKYCVKLYKWLYNQYIGNQNSGYQILIGETFYNPEDSSYSNYNGSPSCRPLKGDKFYVLNEFTKDSDPNLCNFSNTIPFELAQDIKKRNILYQFLAADEFYSQQVQFDNTFFTQKIAPFISKPEVIYNGEGAEDCGCGMGIFKRSDYVEGKREYKKAIKLKIKEKK
jgi:hypothetical protein